MCVFSFFAHLCCLLSISMYNFSPRHFCSVGVIADLARPCKLQQTCSMSCRQTRHTSQVCMLCAQSCLCMKCHFAVSRICFLHNCCVGRPVTRLYSVLLSIVSHMACKHMIVFPLFLSDHCLPVLVNLPLANW